MGNFDQNIEVDCDPAPPPPRFTPSAAGCQPGSVLGAGEDLQVILMVRGGISIIGDLTNFIDTGSFTRTLDKTSILNLTATVGGKLGEACCDVFEDAYQWAAEIAVFRDGRDAWVGPVTELNFAYGQVRLSAADLTSWWERRVLPDLNFVGTDLADIFLAYHEAALAPDPSPNFTVNPTPTGIYDDRQVFGAEFDYAMDHMSELARGGVDYTAYGRTVLAGGQEVPAQPYVTLLDEHWDTPPDVNAKGNQQATEVIVKGKGVSASARDQEYIDFYGLLTRVFIEEDIETVEACQAAADSRLDFLKDPIFIEPSSGAASLRTTAPITLPELIPGMRIRVDSQATCRKLVRDFRLQEVGVNFNGAVTLIMQPLGTVDLNALAVDQGGGV